MHFPNKSTPDNGEKTNRDLSSKKFTAMRSLVPDRTLQTREQYRTNANGTIEDVVGRHFWGVEGEEEGG